MSHADLSPLEQALAGGDLAHARAGVESWLAEPRKFVEIQSLSALIADHDRALVGRAGDPWRIAVLGDCTTQPIRALLPVVGLALGRRVAVYESDYDTYRMEVLDSASPLFAFRPEVAIFATSAAALQTWPAPGMAAAGVQDLARGHVESLASLWRVARERSGAFIVQHSFEPPAFGEPGGRGAEARPWTRTGYVRALNDALWAHDGDTARILDIQGLARRVGSWVWTDPRLYFHSKHAFHPNHAADYALSLIGLLRAHLGRSKKVLVTDLDNTLWGGAIGDDGPGGIAFSSDSAEGEAHLSYARYLAGLRARGVLLAVCSKNDERIAREGFNRPGLPLDLSSFAAFVCNFEPKADNLRRIAQELNVGVDSLVFVDDDIVECASVRHALPEVTVVARGDDPAGAARRLERMALFDALDFTAEDFSRAAAEGARRITAEAAASPDADTFLAGLDMRATVRRAEEGDLARIEQLFKKTNQFNLTQRAFDAAGLRQLLADPGVEVLLAEIEDRYVHYGVVAALVAGTTGQRLDVRNWVVSCRVFARTFEDFLLAALWRRAESRGLVEVVGEFRDSPKNGYARRFLERHGRLDGGQWRFDAAGLASLRTHVRDSGEGAR